MHATKTRTAPCVLTDRIRARALIAAVPTIKAAKGAVSEPHPSSRETRAKARTAIAASATAASEKSGRVTV